MGTAPHGRDNGLPRADSYVPLVDVDPPVADHVLQLLGGAGVAAVAEPLAGEVGPYRDVRPVRKPTERVHVDRDRAGRAREVVAASLPTLRAEFHADAARRTDAAQMRDAEVDAAFEDLVSGFDRPTAGGVGRWPASEDSDDETVSQPEPAPKRLTRRATDEGDDPAYWPQDHYVPPPPPPLPTLTRTTRFGWLGLLGGPLLLLLNTFVDLGFGRWVDLVAIGAFFAGFITLVVNMPDRAPHDDSWDDGAVV